MEAMISRIQRRQATKLLRRIARSGAAITQYSWGPSAYVAWDNGEGVSFSEIDLFPMDDGTFTMLRRDGGTDCDGRHETDTQCHLSKRGRLIGRRDSTVYDSFAVAAGY